jgi:hypothetical protein
MLMYFSFQFAIFKHSVGLNYVSSPILKIINLYLPNAHQIYDFCFNISNQSSKLHICDTEIIISL